MHERLDGRIAVVTGASAGIGEAIARDLAAHGARLVLNARRRPKLDEVAARIGPDRAAVVAGDAADPAVINAMFDAARERFGEEADLVVVNAGRGLNGSVTTSDPEQWEGMIRTNLLAAARLLREAAARLLADIEHGTDWQQEARDIVVIGSNVGRHISPFSSMYGSTKFAVNSLAEALRREIGPKGVRVTLIEPGFVRSEFQGVAGYAEDWFAGVVDRIGPVLTPDDVAELVSFIVSRPPAVNICDALIRPTRQDYP
ncbi:MAG TPA: SDR family oxidoreductase [Phycisphaerales bacterium]|nr:SDR family oxidoreductase [Phycisphaerales bacterium]